jgi:Uma2 family endonuclease
LSQTKSADVATQPEERERVLDWFRHQVWSPDAYLALATTSNRPLELSDGQLMVLPMPTLSHQRAVRRFVEAVSPWLTEAGGEVIFAPHPIRLWPGKYREPDVMVYRVEHLDRLGERESGPPDLVLEVQSPGTSRLDTIVKLEEYAQAGIAEYWMADLGAQRVSVFVLEADVYHLLAHFGPHQMVTSSVLTGFVLPVDSLLGEP